MASRTAWTAAAALLAALLTPSIPAQAISSSPDACTCLKGRPYTATRKTTTVQTLADGTTITHETRAREARDSEGRTVQELPLSRYEEEPAAAPKIVQVMVMDPVARTLVHWTVNENTTKKIAYLTHLPDPLGRPAERPQVSATTSGNATHVVTSVAPAPSATPQHRLRQEVTSETLPDKTIGNVYVRGTRITTTYPVGMVGNDRPLVTTTELWRSPDLKLVILQVRDDPRSGRRTEELTDINTSEPDPSLFQPPAGYTIKDQTPNAQE